MNPVTIVPGAAPQQVVPVPAHVGPPDHLPFTDGPWRHRMHVRPLEGQPWLQVGPSYVADLAERARVLQSHREQVLVHLDGPLGPLAHGAADEVLDAVLHELLSAHPGTVEVCGDVVLNRRTGEEHRRSSMHPIELAGRLVQEDLLLLVSGGPDDPPVLGAACVCFPSRWDLPAKLGREMHAIHAPVPRLNEQLGHATDAFLARLTPQRPVWRLAWSLIDLPELYQPAGTRRHPGQHGSVHQGNVATEVYLRVERETLRRFPLHGSVLFTIRTTVTPLGWFADHPDHAARLAAAVRAIPDDVADYKGVAPVRPEVLAWLDAVG